MKFYVKKIQLFLWLIVIGLTLTGSTVFADETQVEYPGSTYLDLNTGLVLTDDMQSTDLLSTMTRYMATFDVSLENPKIKKIAKNSSSVSNFVPITSSLGTKGSNPQLFNTLLKSFQDRPHRQYYFDSSPLYCSGG
jgi:hypothetical protein